jgi:beta-N-acetylhexosaminidase
MSSDLNLGQLFVMGFDGHTVSDDARRLLKGGKLGGAILFKRNIDSLEQVIELNSELVALGTETHPTLISVDQEGGRVARLRGIMTDLPSMRAVGAASLDDEDLPYRLGAMMARELGALGFHMDYAPVLDVDTNPDNPVIGERAFAREPERVAHHGAQMIRGLQQAGVAACGKHFPGHGDTEVDSHLALPTLPHDLDRLTSVELVPFEAAVAAGVASIMTAHVLFPALDGELPATLSRPILHGLLRQRLGYDGVIVSDDLEMAGVAAHWEVEELVIRGLKAGVDQFLICHTAEKVDRAIAATEKALASGELDRAAIEEKLRRVAELKQRFIGAPAPPDLDEAKKLVRCGPHLELAASVSEDAAARARPDSAVDVS